MPFIHKWVAVMPDVHQGIGAAVGRVIPAAAGVDIGCGMMAVQTTLKAEDLPEDLSAIRSAIEEAVPRNWRELDAAYKRIIKRHTLKQIVCVKG